MKTLLAVMNILGFILQADAQIPTEKTLLWEVKGNGITQPSYLFGTIHLMCPDDLVVPATVKEKFAGSKQLFLEIDMDDPQLTAQMLQGMQMKDSTLEQLLGNQYEKVSGLFQRATGMPLTMLNHTKPFMLMSMIYPSLLGCTPASWEQEFQQMAKTKGMEVNGLERLEDQINVFEKIPYRVQSDMFARMLTEIDSSKQEFNRMMELYKQKDISQLNALTTEDQDFSAYEALIVSDRNHNWIPVIGEQAKKMPTFFAFGAGHLGGEKGVINLLRKSGFTVTPIFYK